MGRARLTMKRIPKERARKIAFMQRRKGLMKKMSEFSTMCGVEAALIVYDDNGDAQPMTWPQDPAKLHAIIEKYECEKNERPPKKFDLENYFENRKNMVEAEISKVRKEIFKIKYPTWDPSFNNLGEEQLRNFIATLDTKIEACNKRINMMKNKHQVETYSSFMQNMAQSESAAPNPSQPNLMQNISNAPMKPLDDNNQIASSQPKHDMGSQSQMPHFDPNFIQLMAKNNGMVDYTNQRINMLKNKHQGETYFSFMQNMAQSENAAPNPSQPNLMQNISHAPMKPLDDNNQLASSQPKHDMGSQSQMPHFDPNFIQLTAKNNGMVDSTNQRINMLKNKHQVETYFSFIQNMAQSESAAPNPSQPNLMQNISQAPMKPLDDNNQLASSQPKHDMGSQSQMPHFDPNLIQLMAKNNGMVDSTNQVDVPLDCSKQIGTSVDSINQFGEPEYWASQLGEPEYWASQLGEPEDWTCQLGELMDCAGLPYEPVLQNIPSHSWNVQQGAALHTLPPPMDTLLLPIDGFQTDDYNNMLYAQLFNHMNGEK